MNRVAEFEKVSEERFVKDLTALYGADFLPDYSQCIYKALKMPVRATSGSAGYDFKAPFGFTLTQGQAMVIPTGIRAKIDPGWVLMIFPRSGLGFKYGEALANSVGVVDSDYYESDNEGHIFLKIVNRSPDGRKMVINAGDGFAQGVFLPFGITVSDAAEASRNGGMGSTGA